MKETLPRFVAIANGRYARLSLLKRAVPDAHAIADLLRDRHHYEPYVLADLTPGKLQVAIDRYLRAGVLGGGTLIVSWTGHGKLGADGTLRLLGRMDRQDIEVAEAKRLGEWAARTGARQALVLIDTCYSGRGLPDAVAIARAIISGRSAPGSEWFCVVAASLGDEPALSGALASQFIRVLSQGPINPDDRWGKKHPFIRGDDLVRALLEDWPEPRQTPQLERVGLAWDLIHNPFYEEGTPDQPVEHLLLAARGSSSGESAFTGREGVLAQIVAWMRRGAPGVFVVTGPPGSGKSAVLGRIVSLSSSLERERLLKDTAIPEHLDPGRASVDAHLHARRVTLDTGAAELARQLGLDADNGHYGVLAEARRRRKDGPPLVIAIDGLDEAGEHSRNLALQLIQPLAREALVLVGTREVMSGEQPSLISLLVPLAHAVDLGQDSEATRRDVRNYVIRRLDGVDPAMEPALVADELVSTGAGGAESQDVSFLLARLVTSQLRDQPVDTSTANWRPSLATSVESALERDLQGAVLEISGKSHPTAARELLRALTRAHGGGFPADDLWPRVATALSPSGTSYNRDDAYALVGALSRHIVAGSEGDQPVYRIAHQRLVDYMASEERRAPGTWGEDQAAAAVAEVVFQLYDELLESGLAPRQHTYLWRYAWLHLAEAGVPGLDRLRDLVSRDREAFLPDLAAALGFAGSRSWSMGTAEEAVVLLDEAVEIYRELKDQQSLVMPLFALALARASAGDYEGADRAAAEASAVARNTEEEPVSRAVLGSALVARASTQLREGDYKDAKLLADQAIALMDLQVASDVDTWPQLAGASTIAGTATLLLGDLHEATRLCQRAVDLVDQHSDNSENWRPLLTDVLAAMAFVQFNLAQTAVPDETGTYPRADTSAAERLLVVYREAGALGTVADIATARGMMFLVLTDRLDRDRGLEVVRADDPLAILDEAIALMEHLARSDVDAIGVLAGVLWTRSLLLTETDQARAEEDWQQAERRLRQVADRSPLAAAQLGWMLQLQVALHLDEAEVNPEGVLKRQQEAVSFLRKGTALFHRIALAQGLTTLAVLLQRTGQSEVAVAVYTEAVAQWRDLIDHVPQARTNLALNLVDLSGLIYMTRPVEAIDLAREALALTREMPQDAPFVTGLIGLVKLNMTAGLLTLGETDDVRRLIEEAIAHLTPLSEIPLYVGALATAYSNLAQVELADGHFGDALAAAQRSLDLFNTPGISPALGANLPLARINLGMAQRGVGEVDLGTQTLREVIDELRVALTANKSEWMRLAAALNIAGSDIWDEVLADLTDQPELRRRLTIARQRPRDEMHITVRMLMDALADEEATHRRMVRDIARQHRSADPASFDALWCQSAGEIPAWLVLDISLEPLVVAWWNTPTWQMSRDYLESHRMLLDPSTDILLEEFRFDGADNGSTIDRYLDLLARARKVGVGAAYAPLLAEIAVNEWIESEDPEEYLDQHDELLGPEVAAVLEERAEAGELAAKACAGIVTLVARGERTLAFQALNDPAATLAYLGPSWRSHDIARLSALAAICFASGAADAHVKQVATVALSIARVLDGHPDEAQALAAAAFEEGAGDDREELRDMVVDAITSHPGQAADLAQLLAILRGPEEDAVPA